MGEPYADKRSKNKYSLPRQLWVLETALGRKAKRVDENKDVA